MQTFKIIKGKKDINGRIREVCKLGNGYYDSVTGISILKLNGLEKKPYSLHRSKDPFCDFVLYYDDSEPIAVAHFLKAPNDGMIQLHWDLYGSNIYLDFNDPSKRFDIS